VFQSEKLTNLDTNARRTQHGATQLSAAQAAF